MSKEKLMGLKLKSKTVQIEGVTVIVKEMNAGDAQKYESSLYTVVGNKVNMNMEEAKTKLIMFTVYDEEGNRMFNTKDSEQVKLLPAHVVNKLFDEASDINGISAAKN